jgi:hypothetical protein
VAFWYLADSATAASRTLASFRVMEASMAIRLMFRL